MSGGGLPFNQAPGARRDDRIGGVEDRAARTRELPTKDNWYISPLPLGVALGDRTGLTANLLRLYYLGRFGSFSQLSQARLNITTLSAGAAVRAALFSYDTTGQARLVKLPETEVKFLADATGVQSVLLPTKPDVSPGQFFLGVKASDNILGVGGAGALTFARTLPVYTYADAAGALPSALDFTSLTKSYTTALLDVLYLNHDAARVL